MSSLITPVWGRPYPSESDVPDVAADLHSLALSLESVPLFPTTATTSRTGVNGESVAVSPSQTLTLPASPVKGDRIQIIALGTVAGATPVTVAGGGKTINGVGLSGASSFLLGTPNSNTTVQYDGTAWRVIDGQQDTGWVLLTLPVTNVLSFGALPASARLRGDTIRLKGFLKNLTGSPIAANTVIANYPNAWGPSSGIEIVTFDTLTSNTTHAVQTDMGGNRGAMALAETWATNGGLVLDGLTFTIA
jgi:hypothetical protein